MNRPENKKITIVAGTFGHLHKGHKELLKRAVSTGNRVIIGLTSDDYVRRTKTYEALRFETRAEAIRKFLKTVTDNYSIKALENNSGDSETNPDYAVIVVSRETEKGAILLNKKRVKNGLKPMRVISVNTAIANDLFIISSSRIDSREIDEKGKRLIPLKIRILISGKLARFFKETVLQSLFRDVDLNVDIGVLDSSFNSDFSKLIRENSSRIENFDYLMIISEFIIPYMESTRTMVAVRAFIMDRDGIINQGLGTTLEMSEKFYDNYVLGNENLNLKDLSSAIHIRKMIRESIEAGILGRKKPWEYGSFERLKSQ
ncbi:MAG: phosphopantetheine adenylyltransferase [Cuniculiplasma sp.]